MTDNLRDRIAAAIYTDNAFGWSEYECREAADAVIAALDLRCQPGFSTMDPDARADDYRYITRWWPVPCDGKCAKYECGCPIPDRDTE